MARQKIDDSAHLVRIQLLMADGMTAWAACTKIVDESKPPEQVRMAMHRRLFKKVKNYPTYVKRKPKGQENEQSNC